MVKVVGGAGSGAQKTYDVPAMVGSGLALARSIKGVTTSVEGTTSETVIASWSIAANEIQSGSVVKLEATGHYSSALVTPGNITLRLRYGGVAGTILVASAATGLGLNLSSRLWTVGVLLTVRTASAASSVQAQGIWNLFTTAAVLQANELPLDGTPTPNLTTAGDLVLTWQFSALGLGANTANCTQAIYELWQ